MTKLHFTRRRLLQTGAAASGLLLGGFPAIAMSGRPQFTHGIQSGDVSMDGAMVWARADKPARLWVEVATTESFKDAMKLRGPAALPETDYTAKLDLTGLPAGQDVFYRVTWQDLADVNLTSEPMTGRFRTPPAHRRDISFVWSGDTAGQGWGINLDWGGMKIYEVMRKHTPDFFIHSGDTIYADGPIKPEVTLEDGTVWKNVMIEEKAKVAETLAEFRGNYAYNLMDENVKRLAAEVPMFAQWDDHETTNNWYPQEMLSSDDRYTVKSAALLSARANRAFLEYMPIRPTANAPEQIHRKISYGPMLDIFFIDMRTFRGPNSPNDQAQPCGAADFLGAEQVRWLKQELLASKALWKVIAADMPIGIIVRDGKTDFENGANGDGPVRGREHDIADILRFIKHNDIANTVWLTADVHYTAAHYYDPNLAQFQDFEPFWEFVSGPLNAGTFGPGDMDNTFGPQVKFSKDPAGKANLPPTAGLQFFGHVKIDGATGEMTVTLRDIADQNLYQVMLPPKNGHA